VITKIQPNWPVHLSLYSCPNSPHTSYMAQALPFTKTTHVLQKPQITLQYPTSRCSRQPEGLLSLPLLQIKCELSHHPPPHHQLIPTPPLVHSSCTKKCHISDRQGPPPLVNCSVLLPPQASSLGSCLEASGLGMATTLIQWADAPHCNKGINHGAIGC